jgi:DNA-binding HxlR family transcriptional regulator
MRPAALDYSVDNCTIGRAMEILGEKWTIVVMREIFQGIRRFDDMRVRTDIPRQVLANRLTMLVETGLLRKVPYREPGSRERHEYRPTQKGLDVYPVLVAVAAWGDRYLAGPEGPSQIFVHRECQAEVHAELHCAAGHQIKENREVGGELGPGAKLRA